MRTRQFEEIVEWQNKTFPGATALSKLRHLELEVKELSNAIENIEGNTSLEIADCILLIYGCAAKLGLDYDDITNAIDKKMLINKKRQWGKPDANGVVNHIK